MSSERGEEEKGEGGGRTARRGREGELLAMPAVRCGERDSHIFKPLWCDRIDGKEQPSEAGVTGVSTA